MKTDDAPPNPQRFQKHYTYDELPALPADQKTRHIFDGIFDAIAQAIEEGSLGQPPMVERFRTAMAIVEMLESKGVPFGVCPGSRMNKELRRLLNEAIQSSDTRKSRRKQIGEGATRRQLRQIKTMRQLADHFIKLPPYSD
jgi:hypothetical protein